MTPSRPASTTLAFIALAASLVIAIASPAAATDGAAGAAPDSALTPPSDARAVRIAGQVMKALGGEKKWDRLEGLRWTFGVSVNDTVRSNRRHAWDKHTGWHRVDYKSAAGDSYCIIHKVGANEGRAWANGNSIEGDSLKKLIARGMRLWTNDAYWMLMPYKLRDPGVTLLYDSQKELDGKTFDVLSMTFNKVGQTPLDHYWVYVNRANHRVEHWEMVLQGGQPPPEAYSWGNWVKTGGLWFPTEHRQDHSNVFTRDVETVTSFAPGEFTTR